ncbi:uncharacterized protein ACOB7L_019282 isoform 1-T2 [Callospermophilus lateralis]|uniref:uncharacterized protein LOC143637754 n=1 Tax=Callospermophilus lateralis TaxID=76772 RepID=UPI004038DA7F
MSHGLLHSLDRFTGSQIARGPPGTLASSLSWFNHPLHIIRLNKEGQKEKEEVEEALTDSLMRTIRHLPVTMNCLIFNNLPAAVLTVGLVASLGGLRQEPEGAPSQTWSKKKKLKAI